MSKRNESILRERQCCKLIFFNVGRTTATPSRPSWSPCSSSWWSARRSSRSYSRSGCGEGGETTRCFQQQPCQLPPFPCAKKTYYTHTYNSHTRPSTHLKEMKWTKKAQKTQSILLPECFFKKKALKKYESWKSITMELWDDEEDAAVEREYNVTIVKKMVNYHGVRSGFIFKCDGTKSREHISLLRSYVSRSNTHNSCISTSASCAVPKQQKFFVRLSTILFKRRNSLNSCYRIFEWWKQNTK